MRWKQKNEQIKALLCQLGNCKKPEKKKDCQFTEEKRNKHWRENPTLVTISLIIGSPIAYFMMSEWLEKFTYRTNISWTVFVVASSGSLLITLITVSYQAIKSAIANPVDSLKTE